MLPAVSNQPLVFHFNLTAGGFGGIRNGSLIAQMTLIFVVGNMRTVVLMKRVFKTAGGGVGISILAGFLLADSAWAHTAYIFAWIENDRVFCESYFSSSKRIVNASIKAFDKDSKLIIVGKTDGRGLFNFKRPHISDFSMLTIMLESSAGQTAEFKLAVELEE